jgi:hypothetical protein
MRDHRFSIPSHTPSYMRSCERSPSDWAGWNQTLSTRTPEAVDVFGLANRLSSLVRSGSASIRNDQGAFGESTAKLVSKRPSGAVVMLKGANDMFGTAGRDLAEMLPNEAPYFLRNQRTRRYIDKKNLYGKWAEGIKLA